MQFINLESFEEYIRSRNLVSEEYIPHYSRWVLRFLRSEDFNKHDSTRDMLQGYSDQLARDDSVADWQLRQAMKTVDSYSDGRRLTSDLSLGVSTAGAED